jgi:predicted transposase YdaD
MKFNDKLYIVKKTINGERINDLELAKEYYGADYVLRPKTSNDYIFLETEQNRLYVQKPLEYLIEVGQHKEIRMVESGTNIAYHNK